VDQQADEIRKADGETGHGNGPTDAEDAAGLADGGMVGRSHSKRGILWILAGLVILGVTAGYKWWKELPR
jgi:hypothetical protein